MSRLHYTTLITASYLQQDTTPVPTDGCHSTESAMLYLRFRIITMIKLFLHVQVIRIYYYFHIIFNWAIFFLIT